MGPVFGDPRDAFIVLLHPPLDLPIKQGLVLDKVFGRDTPAPGISRRESAQIEMLRGIILPFILILSVEENNQRPADDLILLEMSLEHLIE